MLNGKELQIGKSYETRSAGVVTLSEYNNDKLYPWESYEGYTYNNYGSWDSEESEHDLIKEHNSYSVEHTQEFNVVTKPKHYQLFPEFGIEVKDVVALLCNRLGTNGYNGAFIADFAQMLQYLMRFDEKNGKEDLEKSMFFLESMIEKYPDVQTLKGRK